MGSFPRVGASLSVFRIVWWVKSGVLVLRCSGRIVVISLDNETKVRTFSS